MWVLATLVCIVVVAMVAFGACQRRAVNAAIERSTTPILVPAEPWNADFDFTAPPGTTNLYLFRWNFDVGATDAVTGWQVGPGADFDPPSLVEAPGEAEVQRILTAANDAECPVVDSNNQTALCTYPAEFELGGVHAFLVRPMPIGEGSTLVVEYVNRGGDRGTYNPDALEARYAAADFAALAIDGDLSDYLVAIY